MKKIKHSKLLIEALLASILYLIYLFTLPLMKIRATLSKKALFIPLKNSYQLTLHNYNTSCKLIKFLPLSKAILEKNIFLVGTYLYASSDSLDFKPGIISLYGLRILSDSNHDSVEKINHEYIQNRNIIYDFTLTLRFLISSVFLSSRKVYLSRLNLMGVVFRNKTIEEVIDLIKTKVQRKEKSKVHFINAETLNKTHSNIKLRTLFNKTPYVFPHGSGIKTACNMMNMPLKQNIKRTDMFSSLYKMAEEEKIKIFFYGAAKGVAEKMKEELLKQFPHLQIVGCVDGFTLHDNEVINMVNHTQTDILFVAKNTPFQEKWIEQHAQKITAPVIMGVGELFDFYSRNMQRAPMWRPYIIGNPLFLLRAYLWNKEQKNKRMQKYHAINPEEKNKSIFPDFSYLSYLMYPIVKRAIDIVVTSLAILLLSPILILVALVIRIESKGNIIFSHKRVGIDGKLFSMFKFRSMVQNAEALKKDIHGDNESKDGVIFKMKEDPRITRVGKFIRKWSIDEVPQLFNVLKGDMSLVGPRPPIPTEVAQYINDDLKRLDIIPGITCIWQVSGRSHIPFKEQVILDKQYISTRSLWIDIKILFATIPAVLTQRGAY